MKLLLIIFLFFSAAAIGQKDSTIRIITGIVMNVGDSLNLTATPIAADSTAALYKLGTMAYASSSYTVVKSTENIKDELNFYLKALKVGKSTITVKCTTLTMPEKVVSKSFVVTVMSGAISTSPKAVVDFLFRIK